MPALGLVLDAGKPASPAAETFGPPGDPYTIGARLGRGVSATVYRCSRGRDVFAVKVILLAKLRLQPNFARILEKVHRESTILFAMRHSHIVSLYDVYETREKLYLVMEYVEGGELLGELNRGGSSLALPEHEVRYIFLQLVRGLRYIHSKGVVHRDLKLENVLVDRRASRPGLVQVKISDFGHSRLVNDGYSTALTHGVGTPQYWAPEVATMAPSPHGYDERVDLWSLGVLLHVMLVGMYPSPPPVNFRADSSVSPEAQRLVQGLMQVEPDCRLTLNQCLRHPWVMMPFGPLSRILAMCEGLESRRRQERERRVVLPRDPRDVRKFRRDLHSFTVSSKLPVTLRHREVLISFAADASAETKEAGWRGLLAVLWRHYPGVSFADTPEVPSAPAEEDWSLTDFASSEDLSGHDAELLAAMKAYPECVEAATGESGPVPRRAELRLPVQNRGWVLELHVELAAGCPSRNILQVGALSLGAPQGEENRATDAEQSQLQERILAHLRSGRSAAPASGSGAADTAASASDAASSGATSSSKGAANGPLVALLDWLHNDVLPTLNADAASAGAGDAGDAAAASAIDAEDDRASNAGEGSMANQVKCARICLVTHHHDEKLDARYFRAEGSRRTTSFFGHLKNNFPDVSGLLGFGRPAVLFAEGPYKVIMKFQSEVNKSPWWRAVDQKDFKVSDIGDVEKWRVFTGFTKVAIGDLQEVCKQAGLTEMYEAAVAGTVLDPERKALTIESIPKRKPKGKIR